MYLIIQLFTQGEVILIRWVIELVGSSQLARPSEWVILNELVHKKQFFVPFETRLYTFRLIGLILVLQHSIENRSSTLN